MLPMVHMVCALESQSAPMVVARSALLAEAAVAVVVAAPALVVVFGREARSVLPHGPGADVQAARTQSMDGPRHRVAQ